MAERNAKITMNLKISHKVLLTFILIINLAYIIWRCIYTLPTKFGIISLIIGIIFFVIELTEILEFTIHYINTVLQKSKNVNLNNNEFFFLTLILLLQQ